MPRLDEHRQWLLDNGRFRDKLFARKIKKEKAAAKQD